MFYFALRMAKAGYKQKAKRQPHGSNLDTSKAVDANGLTAKEELFCQMYMLEFSIVKASAAVGLQSSGGYALMTRPHIQKRIAQIRDNASKVFDITRERILQRLSQIIYGDPRQLFTKNQFTNPDKWSDEVAAIVAGVKVNAMTKTIESVKSHDVLKAIELLNKMMGYNSPEIKKIDLSPVNYDKAELLEIAKMMEGLI